MLALHPQYIVDETQAQQAVVIQINEWQEVIKQLEMLDDIEAYDKAKKHKSEAIPFKQAIKEIKNH
ncbi:hypothetical protein BSPLISOX_232 [uncultured Gammaproteobacteria bacterium]|jgi:hypothetical protein|nr:hypothetical protein [uncultured Gammaproteobacteria bacterium]VVH65470.1 hypothetical protein BSPLISOX_232 [uncultured Gammaproteobacteria bacterium]